MVGAINVSLETDKPVYRVGDTPTYVVRAAIPGSQIAWTSFKDGQTTGEFNANYGQIVGNNGTAELVAGGPWTSAEVGRWEKQATIIAPDGSMSIAQVKFVVTEAAPAAASPVPTVPGGGFWSNPLFSLGDFDVTPGIALVGFGALYLLTKKR